MYIPSEILSRSPGETLEYPEISKMNSRIFSHSGTLEEISSESFKGIPNGSSLFILSRFLGGIHGKILVES